MPLQLRIVLNRCRLHIKTTLVGHSGNMKVRLEMVPQDLTPLRIRKHPDLGVQMGLGEAQASLAKRNKWEFFFQSYGVGHHLLKTLNGK